MSEAITTALQTVVTDTVASLSAVAPIGITIFGTVFAWQKGVKFFRTLAK